MYEAKRLHGDASIGSDVRPFVNQLERGTGLRGLKLACLEAVWALTRASVSTSKSTFLDVAFVDTTRSKLVAAKMVTRASFISLCLLFHLPVIESCRI